jgi:uncharacterized protein (DUF1697 family)
MGRFVAMLRGVNVGGNTLGMDRMRELCEGLGFKGVQTYVQSGNVVFESNRPAATLAGMIEKSLNGETRLPVSVIVRTAAEMQAIIAANPFIKEKGIDLTKLHVTFLAKAPSKEGSKNLAAIPCGEDRFRIVGLEVFLHCPLSYGETKLSNNAIQKALGVNATTRNWNTVNKLFEMTK